MQVAVDAAADTQHRSWLRQIAFSAQVRNP